MEAISSMSTNNSDNSTTGAKPVRYALVSVSYKKGIMELGKFLIASNITIISTAGTGKMLNEGGIPTITIADVVGQSEFCGKIVKFIVIIIKTVK